MHTEVDNKARFATVTCRSLTPMKTNVESSWRLRICFCFILPIFLPCLIHHFPRLHNGPKYSALEVCFYWLMQWCYWMCVSAKSCFSPYPLLQYKRYGSDVRSCLCLLNMFLTLMMLSADWEVLALFNRVFYLYRPHVTQPRTHTPKSLQILFLVTACVTFYKLSKMI